ncbi:N-terminal binuclear Zn cluster-containing/DNA binding domain-containing protein [Xylariomycetidae sp. FL0641]|nr:N-terminal binuclear Zn cluster-containing/DNA binding domain-containing protein [Xylariomycetidae sp. FL0641]
MDGFSPPAPHPSSDGSPDLYRGLGPEMPSLPLHVGTPGLSSSATIDSRSPPQTVPAACLACRGKHLKCDGATPCSRCQASSSECVYVASRRGYKGPRRNTSQNPNKRHASDSPPDPDHDGSYFNGGQLSTSVPGLPVFNPALAIPDTPVSPFAATPNMNSVQLYRSLYLNGVNSANGALVEANPRQPPPTTPERCIDSFYHHFYPCHPAVLPKDQLLKLAKERNLEHLLAAMRWVGSLYFDVGPARATYFEEAMRGIRAQDVPKDGFLVQAMVIVLIGLDGNSQDAKARDILSDVERVAIEIGLYTRAYATTHGSGNPRMEESWRRTWWDLFVVDGMVAGVHQQTNFLLFDIVADVGLPCEEQQYATGDIPRPMYLEDFDDQLFSGEEREFSSFAYRIASVRILGRMMRMPQSNFPDDGNVDRIQSLLSNWRMHLPESKRHSLDKNGQLDEMMFQAHMISHACSIRLHQPLSQLDSSVSRSVNACAPYRPVQSGDNFNIHTRHIVTAACEISKMVTYSVPITSHTHFFTCVLTVSSIVHLNKWSLYYLEDEDDLRQLIRLNIGALNQLSKVWSSAGRVSAQVKGVAQEIYRDKKAQQNNPSFWVGFTQEEIMGSMAADEGIMSEINLLGEGDGPGVLS